MSSAGQITSRMTARVSAHSMLASAVRSGMAAMSSPAVITGKGYARPVRNVRNLGTYWAQRAAEGRPRPVSTGRMSAIDHILGIRVAAADDQVRLQMRTSSSGWATMHRVTRRCSSVGRAAVL